MDGCVWAGGIPISTNTFGLGGLSTASRWRRRWLDILVYNVIDFWPITVRPSLPLE